MKTKAFSIATIVVLLLPLGLQAQNDNKSIQQSYETFKEQVIKEYNAFLEQAQREFEQFLAEAWVEYQSFGGESGAFVVQKPNSLPSLPAASGVINVKAPSLGGTTFSEEDLIEQKHDVIELNDVKTENITINFYGRSLRFDVPKNLRLTSKGTREKHISEYYESMRQNDPNHLLQHQLSNAVNQMGLNEWGYFALLRSISEKAFNDVNDRVLFSFYMLHSSGFKARVGRGSESGNLLLLLALDNSKEVYSTTFFRIKGTKFYTVYGNGKKGESVFSYNENADYSGLKEIGLDFTKTLNIAACDKQRKLHLNKVNMDVSIPYSTSHLRYYDEIPTTVFPIYFKTSIAPEAEQVFAQIFNTLSKQYNKVQLVDIMLNFVQTAFAYKIDELQFGREKYFFPEEVIGCPFSDCEDRSALFAWLVKRYIGYDIIGVLFNDHLTTAVCFGSDAQLEGKSVISHGKRYIVCDPTYRNAAIGTVMPQHVNAKYEIVEIN